MAVILPFNGKWPRVADDAFLAPTAVLIGDVTIGAGASVWFGAVLRGDDPDNGIVVGVGSSIQDNCVVHVGDWGPTIVGEYVTVGHGAKFESCSIGDRSIVGMNAVILQEAVIGVEAERLTHGPTVLKTAATTRCTGTSTGLVITGFAITGSAITGPCYFAVECRLGNLAPAAGAGHVGVSPRYLRISGKSGRNEGVGRNERAGSRE